MYSAANWKIKVFLISKRNRSIAAGFPLRGVEDGELPQKIRSKIFLIEKLSKENDDDNSCDFVPIEAC